MNPVLIDTSVIIDYLRGLSQAIDFINALDVRPSTSVIVVAELYAGVRDGQERKSLKALLGQTSIFRLNESIAVTGGLFRRTFGKSHNSGLEDCLIAATAQAEGATLITLNIKHFPMLTDVRLPYVVR